LRSRSPVFAGSAADNFAGTLRGATSLSTPKRCERRIVALLKRVLSFPGGRIRPADRACIARQLAGDAD